MIPKTRLIDEIEISAKKKAVKITENEKYAIWDFLMWGNEMLLLEFHGHFKDAYFSRWDRDGQLIHRLKLKGIPAVQEIYRACNDKIYLIGNRQVHLLSFSNELSKVEESYAIDFFNFFILPCELSLDQTVYYQIKT